MKRVGIIVGMLIFGLLQFQSSHADIINGDFSAGLNGWTTEPSTAVEVINGVAVLKTLGIRSGVFLISLYQTFTFPSWAYTLSFDFGFWRDRQDDPNGGFPDFFQASYLDKEDEDYDRIFVAFDYDGHYSLDPDTLTFSELGGGWYRFTTNVSDLAGRQGTLYFDLSDGYDGYYSIAKVDNVQIAPVPEPATLLLLGVGLAGLMGMGRKRFLRE